MPEVTTIKVSKELRDVIAGMGSKRETYEKILWRLVDRQPGAAKDD